METYSEKVGNKVNSLLERTVDANKGYEKAAENVENIALKGYFKKKATERGMFTDQLKSVLRTYNQGAKKEDGSIVGSAHRAWMDLKSTFTSEDSEAMLEETIRGEEKAVEDYQDILAETSLTPKTKEIIEGQLSIIKSSLSTVKKLEDIH